MQLGTYGEWRHYLFSFNVFNIFREKWSVPKNRTLQGGLGRGRWSDTDNLQTVDLPLLFCLFPLPSLPQDEKYFTENQCQFLLVFLHIKTFFEYEFCGTNEVFTACNFWCMQYELADEQMFRCFDVHCNTCGAPRRDFGMANIMITEVFHLDATSVVYITEVVCDALNFTVST